MTPVFHKQVPRTLAENLRWRLAVNRAALESSEVRDQLLQICSRDFLFWVNTFCWTLDPRKLCDAGHAVGSRLPFITWEYQDEAAFTLEEWLQRGSDGLIEKSRDMGASWLVCSWFLWRWLFRSHESYLMVSRTEPLVDGDGDSLFAHLDFIIDSLPLWMLPHDGTKPRWKRIKLKLENKHNGCVIDGESNTDDIGRGGRRTAILLDEFPAFPGGGFEVLSATADTTRCRIFNGTPKGRANAFYAQREKGTPRIRMHWSRHPEKRRGLYRPLGDGKFEKLDPTFDYETHTLVDEVPRSLEGFRSPWYDKECKRRAHRWEIAQEIDIDYQGSDYPFFDPRTLDELRDQFCRQGLVGRLDRTSYGPKFVPDKTGHLTLWVTLDAAGRPPRDRDFVMGCDIGQGSGASDSASVVCDRLSGEKVAELVHNKWSLNVFADLVFMLGEFFQGAASQAELIFEATGPGITFGKIIIDELHYKRFYTHKETGRLGARPTQKYGWYTSTEGKRDLLQNYRELLVQRKFLNPSYEAIREAGFYMFEGDKIEYRGPVDALDPSNNGANHGDRVIADALCAKLLWDYNKGKVAGVVQATMHVQPGSLAWRRRERALSEMADDRYLAVGAE